ncbi:outer membrane protein assembly factor BamB family protein [Paractinoplanes durhamensis]|uniref:Pyrrolo-quinoline quinone repeat domain-containing protein n=1 Tax=Paractinoplanes durhamensis TaxID=113563 RepID=A0ABQ3YNI5_9ACTN|nr:PQQ-binding-like beta-propeller repeat protein [Actinoplanes durhamensis]GID99136.1 hypothetical protein Adu01nite_04870 [Actinoplanes durhamensis]
MTTIELGEIDSRPDPGPPTEFGSHLARRSVTILSLLLCLFGVAASAPGAVPTIHPLWRVPVAESDGTTLGTDTAYLQRSRAGQSHLTAYDLATGAIRWETSIDGTLGYTQLAEQAGLILLPTDPEPAQVDDLRYAAFTKGTTALDIDTGATRWTAPGEPMLISDRTALMVDYSGDGVYARLRLIGIDAVPPRAIWSRETPDVESLAFELTGERADRIITVSRAGVVKVIRFADGTLLAGARIPWRTPDPQQGEFNDVAPAGEYLVVNRARQNDADLTVYHLGTLDEAWQIGTPRGYAFPCGTSVCFEDEDRLTAYDPATGEMRWQRVGLGSSWAAGPDRVVADVPGVGQQLFDADTGLPVGEAGAGETVWTTEPGEAVLVLRATREPAGHTSITRWDLATGRRDLLGAVDNLVVNRCQSVRHYLGCFQGNEFVVTAVG